MIIKQTNKTIKTIKPGHHEGKLGHVITLKLSKIEFNQSYQSKDIHLGNGVFVDLCNIRALNGDLKQQTLAWYTHDVFKKLTYVYWAQVDGIDYFFLEENKLFDKRKIKKLVNSEDFKNERLAFFNYGYAKKLAA